MSKSKIILAAVGGMSALSVVAAAVAVWFAYSGKVAALEGDDEEGVIGLETVRSQVSRFTSSKIYPCPESVKALKADAGRLAGWRTDSIRFASRGDRFFEKTTPAAFKAKIIRDAKAVAAMKGSENGSLVKSDFTFGPFKPYIAEGKMPEEAKLAELQRRWDDVSGLAETLAACEVDEFVSIAFRDGDPEAEKKAEADRKNSRNQRGKKRQEPEKDAFKPSSFSYTAVFRAHPNSIVRVVNAFATCERFIVIDSFTFERERDTLAAALGGDDRKKQEAQQTQSRRRRRRGGVEEQRKDGPDAANAAAGSGIVTDPQFDGPFVATVSFTVYDFNSLAEEGKGESK